MANDFRTSSCPEEAKVGVASYLLKERAYDWWEEVCHALGGEYILTMTCDDFVMRFKVEFVLVIEVQQLAREF